MVGLFWNLSQLATKDTPRVIKYARKNKPPEQPVDWSTDGPEYSQTGPWTVRPRLVRLYRPETGGGQLGALLQSCRAEQSSQSSRSPKQSRAAIEAATEAPDLSSRPELLPELLFEPISEL